MDFIKIPIDFSQVIKGANLKRCSKEESIAQHLMLIITSRYGEVAGKNDYGSVIWELEFNQLIRIHDWEEEVKTSLMACISKYEKRLKDLEIDVLLSEVDDNFLQTKNSHVRRKASINISANMVGNNIPFHFNTIIYISPLAQ